MKKTWSNAAIEVLNIEATANETTTELEVDQYVPGTDTEKGYFIQGTRSGSGTKTTIPYYPEA